MRKSAIAALVVMFTLGAVPSLHAATQRDWETYIDAVAAGASAAASAAVGELLPPGVTDIVSALNASPDIVRTGLILWLNKKMQQAIIENENDTIRVNRYQAFLDCLSPNHNCANVRAITSTIRGTETSANTSGRHYELTRIEVERSFPSGWKPPVEFVGGRGKTTESAGARSFKFGWSLTFGTGGVSIGNGEVTLTEVPTSLDGSGGKPPSAKFGARITGYWDMQGYAFDRDHTVSLSGVAGDAKWSEGGKASRVVPNGEAATSSVAYLRGSDREMVAPIHAHINFGGDDWADMEIRLIYQAP